jgi:formylglycine-generating enzyme required for sulfatase activity
VLGRLGLLLPTEAQWEYAGRAGTETPWWTGAERESLQGAANLADRWAREHGGHFRFWEDWLDDGYTSHAPVGHYRANGFGLHDVLGNVWEWCRDEYSHAPHDLRPGDGERLLPQRSAFRAFRGGGFGDGAANARAADRNANDAADRGSGVGLRPLARVITD